jgi:hypothetical protein
MLALGVGLTTVSESSDVNAFQRSPRRRSPSMNEARPPGPNHVGPVPHAFSAMTPASFAEKSPSGIAPRS